MHDEPVEVLQQGVQGGICPELPPQDCITAASGIGHVFERGLSVCFCLCVPIPSMSTSILMDYPCTSSLHMQIKKRVVQSN